ncbi:hypothetical protein ABGB09_27360 [Streptomyces sp. B8F3]|uniref:hypothetical protein n=1 Tax=Streptomyces sp. B8F3 TaxID=3153573 RepID=UPI00325D185A
MTQRRISEEIAAAHRATAAAVAAGAPAPHHPARDFAPYRSTVLRHPRRPPLPLADPDAAARARLVATYDHALSVPEWSLGYRWDVVLDGPAATWAEPGEEGR